MPDVQIRKFFENNFHITNFRAEIFLQAREEVFQVATGTLVAITASKYGSHSTGKILLMPGGFSVRDDQTS